MKIFLVVLLLFSGCCVPSQRLLNTVAVGKTSAEFSVHEGFSSQDDLEAYLRANLDLWNSVARHFSLNEGEPDGE